MTVRVLKSGERVIVDPAITIQRIYMVSPLRSLLSYHMLKSKSRSSICASTWDVYPLLPPQKWNNLPDFGQRIFSVYAFLYLGLPF